MNPRNQKKMDDLKKIHIKIMKISILASIQIFKIKYLK
jgi:hypothetical protein